MQNLAVKRRNWRKSIRYLRWSSKATFLLLFMVPVAYLAGAPIISSYSFLLGGTTLIKTYISVPITQSVCSIWTSSFGNTNPGGWILCPIGGVQTLLTGQVEMIAIIAMLLFILPIVLLGNFFCSWSCPVGTMIDGFDKFVEKFLPKIEEKRAKRAKERRQNNQIKNHNEHGNLFSRMTCPSCPIGKALSKQPRVVATGVMATAFLSSAVLKVPAFCIVCPIGISTMGLVHIRSLASITGRALPFILELLPIPIIAVLLSLRERRFWCRRLCPVGAILNYAGALNPFIKPRIKEEKCVMKGCPEECEDNRLDFCMHCRLLDDTKCRRVCPVDIDLSNRDSLSRCTKCLECYIECDYKAVTLDLVGKPEIFRIGSFFKSLRGRKSQVEKIAYQNEK